MWRFAGMGAYVSQVCLVPWIWIYRWLWAMEIKLRYSGRIARAPNTEPFFYPHLNAVRIAVFYISNSSLKATH